MTAKTLKVLFRLTVPGGLLLLISVIMVRNGFFRDADGPVVRYYQYLVFGIGLLLSALFNRSRLFFALLVVFLSSQVLVSVVPRLSSSGIQVIIFESIAILLPLNLLSLSFMRDRGIITQPGRRRVTYIGLQVFAIGLLTLIRPAHASAAALLDHAFVPKRFSQWSSLSQPALLIFLLAGMVMLFTQLQRRRPVESGLFWTLVTAFLALSLAGAGHLSTNYFAAGGLILVIAVIETSYTMAYRDELTQLPSRRSFNEALLKLGDQYSVAMVDVDHFKKFNDTYGHETGDQVLQMVAARLGAVSGGGKAFRYGGEEFAVLFPGKAVDQAFPSVEALRKVIEQSPFAVRGGDRRKAKGAKAKKPRLAKGQVSITVSIGLSERNGAKLLPEQVLRAADQALYKAKARGRNCTVASEQPAGSRALAFR